MRPTAAIRTLGRGPLAVTLVAPPALAADRDEDGLREGLEPKGHSGMERLIDRISPRTEVLVLGDVPQNRNHPVKCLQQHRGNMAKCTSRWQPIAKRGVEKSLRKAVDTKGERFATLYYKICPTDPCPLVQGKTMMWRDESHLSGTFARKLTPAV